MGWVVKAKPRPLHHRERPVTYPTGGWMGPRAGLEGCFHRDSIPDRPSLSESLYFVKLNCSTRALGWFYVVMNNVFLYIICFKKKIINPTSTR